MTAQQIKEMLALLAAIEARLANIEALLRRIAEDDEHEGG